MPTGLTVQQSREWQDAAMWCARRNLTGNDGEPLPPLLSSPVAMAVLNNPDAFRDEIRLAKYALAMLAR